MLRRKKFVTFSDSMSSLQSINGFNLDSDLVQKFLKYYSILAKNGKNIILCWIPSHVETVMFSTRLSSSPSSSSSGASVTLDGSRSPRIGHSPWPILPQCGTHKAPLGSRQRCTQERAQSSYLQRKPRRTPRTARSHGCWENRSRSIIEP